MATISLLFCGLLLLSVESRPVKLWHLKEKNLEKAKEQNPIIILYHKAPLDENSTDLLEGLTEAIKKMEHFGVNAGEINCTTYPKACKNHGVKKPPLLKFYPHRGVLTYKEENTADAIYEWIKKSTEKSLRVFRTYEECEELFPELDSVFIGWFPDKMNIEFTTYESCASSPKEKSLYLAVVNSSIEKTKIEYHHLTENWHEKFSGKWDWGALTRWMGDVQSPFVDEITSDNAERFHKTTTPCGYIIYDGKTDDIENMRKIGTQLGKKFRKQILPVLLDHSKHPKVAETLGLDASQVPGFTIVAPFPSYDEEAKAHYPLYTDAPVQPDGTAFSFTDELWRTRHSSINNVSIAAHVQAFLDHKLPLPIRTQPASVTEEALQDTSRALIPITGATFNKTALNLEKDVVVLFETAWCSKCKRLHNQIESLAKDIKASDLQQPAENKTALLFGTFDSVENDVWPYYRVDEYPTILFFPKGDKFRAIRCNETQSVEKIKRFLQTHSSNFPFEPDQQLIKEDDERQRKREKMEKKMGLDKKKKKYLFEDEL